MAPSASSIPVNAKCKTASRNNQLAVCTIQSPHHNDDILKKEAPFLEYIPRIHFNERKQIDDTFNMNFDNQHHTYSLIDLCSMQSQ